MPHKLSFAAGVLVAGVISFAASETSPAAFRFGIVIKNVTCKNQSRPRRQKYVSQVFSYCPLDISRPGIVEETKREFESAMTVYCGAERDITFEDVVASDTESEATRDRQKALNE